MTRNDDHLQGPAPTQKLEWVTPKISLMEAGGTEGKPNFAQTESNGQQTPLAKFGPS